MSLSEKLLEKLVPMLMELERRMRTGRHAAVTVPNMERFTLTDVVDVRKQMEAILPVIQAAEKWATTLHSCAPSSFARSMAMAEAEENLLAALAAHGPSQEKETDKP